MILCGQLAIKYVKPSEEFFTEVQEYIKAHKMKLKDFGITAMRRMLEDAAPADHEEGTAVDQE